MKRKDLLICIFIYIFVVVNSEQSPTITRRGQLCSQMAAAEAEARTPYEDCTVGSVVVVVVVVVVAFFSIFLSMFCSFVFCFPSSLLCGRSVSGV